ncbi:MAG: hypothetical protein FJ388_16325 [Verrucomicrobia bacterium]|nr:hypothetical protein [Verrucomicrobiota bacterium]
MGWIEGGGTLFCSGLPGLYDPWGRRLARLMWETLGIDDAHLAATTQYEQPLTPALSPATGEREKTCVQRCDPVSGDRAQSSVSGFPLPIGWGEGQGEGPQRLNRHGVKNQKASWRWRVDVSRLKPHCVLMATDDAGEPLAIRAKHGRGEIIVSLVPFFDVKQARDYWPWKLHERVKREIESPERNLYLDWRTCDDRRTFFSVAINLSPYAPVKTQVIANDLFSRVLNLSTDGGAKPLPLEKGDFNTSFPLELPPGGGAVLMLEKASARR